MVLVDFNTSDSDLKDMFPDLTIDLTKFSKLYPHMKLYAKFRGQFPTEFKKTLDLLGISNVMFDADHVTTSITKHIIQVCWKAALANEFDTVILVSSDLDLLPLARCLTMLGKKVIFISNKNAKVFTKEGFEHIWLHALR